jgi:hypothetical protein
MCSQRQDMSFLPEMFVPVLVLVVAPTQRPNPTDGVKMVHAWGNACATPRALRAGLLCNRPRTFSVDR